MSGFERFDRGLGVFYSWIGTAIGLAIGFFALAISIDLILRLAGLGNLPGIQEIIEYMLFASVFLGAPWVLRLGSHIRVDVLVSALSRASAKRLEQGLNVFGAVLCAVLVYFGSVNLRDAYLFQAMQMKYYNVPEWWLLSVFVFSFTLLSIEFLSRLMRGGSAPEAAKQDAGGM